MTSFPERRAALATFLAALVAGLLLPTAARAGDSYAWTQYVASGGIEARAITEQAECPKVCDRRTRHADGAARRSKRRLSGARLRDRHTGRRQGSSDCGSSAAPARRARQSPAAHRRHGLPSASLGHAELQCAGRLALPPRRRRSRRNAAGYRAASRRSDLSRARLSPLSKRLRRLAARRQLGDLEGRLLRSGARAARDRALRLRARQSRGLQPQSRRLAALRERFSL